MHTIVLIGDGAVAQALSVALTHAQIAVRQWSRKTADPIPEGDVVILAVSDGAIREVAERVVREAFSPPLLLHCSGALPAEDCLGDLSRPTSGIGVLHPLLAIAKTAPIPDFSGTVFAIEGDDRGKSAAQKLAVALGGRPLVLDRNALPRYHAAAVLVGNHSLGLVQAAVELLASLGLERKEAESALAALYSSTAHNLVRLGLERALTGPIRRGEVAVLERHLSALASTPHLEVYRVTAREVVKLARRGGADPAALADVEALLARA
jgi:predicted short-subunit dehydrogenase-like oxidoreductase (DUF2520 family)